MREVLHNIMTRRNWFFGAVGVLFLVYSLINPHSVVQMVNGLWKLLQMLAAIAFAIVGIRVVLGYKPWWLGGGSGAKKKS